MSIATGARHFLAHGLQNDFTTTQESLTILRATDCSLAPSREEFESAEMQGHGQVVDTRQGMHQAGGDIDFELSYGTFDQLLAGICRSAWSANSTSYSATTIAALAVGNKLSDAAGGFSFSAGDWVKLDFSTTRANNGVYRIGAASPSELTLEGQTLVEAAAGENVTVAGLDTLTVGSSEKYFTVQRAFADIGAYQIYTGCAVNGFSLSIQPNQMVTGSFTLLAREMEARDSALDPDPAPAPQGEPMSGIDLGGLWEGGSALAYVSGLNLSIEGNSAAKPVVGSTAPGFMAWTDAFRVSASLDAYFQDHDLMNKFLAESESSLRVVLKDPEGASFGFDLPRIKYTGNASPTSGRDTITQSAQVKALYHPGQGTSITFFRRAA